MSAYASTIEANLLTFARHLRDDDFLIGPREVSLSLEALSHVQLESRAEVRDALRVVLATNPSEQARFDKAFRSYWHGGLLQPDEDLRPALNPPPKAKRMQSISMLEWDQGGVSEETIDTYAYSAQETKAQGDSAVQINQVDRLQKLVRRLAKQLATKPSRRWTPTSRRGELADLRRTIRHSLKHGGEPLDLKFKSRELGKTRILFIFDVSGSMMVYSHFLLQLAYAFVRQRYIGKTEVFGFSTEVYRLTSHLRRGGVEEAIRAARLAMPGRSGGTKIGSSLERLLERYAQLIDLQTVVIINSDGWDTGDLDALRRAMRTLKERSNRVIWLNPLAGSPGYQPTASGMQTALPYIDVFAASHNLASLEKLERRLMKANR